MAIERACVVPECNRPYSARGFCKRHYEDLRVAGMLQPLTVADRFWAKVEKTEACWLWMGWCQPSGYGEFRLGSLYVDSRGKRDCRICRAERSQRYYKARSTWR